MAKGGGGRGQGNGGGWPSTTGNPSGGGRSNNSSGYDDDDDDDDGLTFHRPSWTSASVDHDEPIDMMSLSRNQQLAYIDGNPHLLGEARKVMAIRKIQGRKVADEKEKEFTKSLSKREKSIFNFIMAVLIVSS